MLDREQACAILGLPEHADPRQIEDRYFLLVKKYKGLREDERPSPEEPVFSEINRAYRYLSGYTPLEKVEFRELTWKEKLEHIREHYVMEITLVLVTILIIFAYGAGIYELSKQLRTLETETPAAPAHDVTTPEEKPSYME